jgi:hypothetical protein
LRSGYQDIKDQNLAPRGLKDIYNYIALDFKASNKKVLFVVLDYSLHFSKRHLQIVLFY